MTALLLQTLLLMLPAFFIGAALACGARKMTATEIAVRAPLREMAPARAVDPLPQYVGRETTPNKPLETPRAASVATPVVQAVVATAAAIAKPMVASAPDASNKFDAALKERIADASRPAPSVAAAPVVSAPVAAPVVAKVVEPARPAPPPPPAVVVAKATPAPISPAPVSAPVAVALPVAPAAAPATSAMIASAAAAAAAAAAVVATQARAATVQVGASSVIAPVVMSAAAPTLPPIPSTPARTEVVAKPVSSVPDDLTSIGVVDPALNSQLAKLGVTRFSQIAGWRKSDVASISSSLGLQGRIEQENWIEQAQILANGGETYYSARRGRGSSAVDMSAKPAAIAETLKTDSTASSVVPTATAVVPAAAAAAVAKTGEAKAPQEVASVAPAGAPQVEQRSAFANSPASQRAVEAPGLAVAAPVVATLVKPTETTAASTVADAAVVAASGGAASVTSTAAAINSSTQTVVAESVRPAMAPARDNLQRVSAINAEIERLLGGQGVNRYSQVASWNSGDVERFDRLLGSQGRIGRENWVEQAQILAKGGDTAYSREFDRRAAEMPRDAGARPKSIAEAIKVNSAAPAPRQDIGALRSVRSDAYKTSDAATAAAVAASSGATAAAAAAAASLGSAKVVRSAEMDDLKRIRGVGVLIEKRLNQAGIVSYGQIADWTNEDIDRVSASLDFKGRIERENWVEQARILASGGQTEFSRRVDRGEVETSRPKT
jgi:predicted flap endonuclease-1-like 5' DNA nuclease